MNNLRTLDSKIALTLGQDVALLLNQMIYWQKKATKNIRNEKWFYKLDKEWLEELPFFKNVFKIRRLKKVLRDKNLIFIEYHLVNNKRTTFIKVNYPKILEMFGLRLDIAEEINANEIPNSNVVEQKTEQDISNIASTSNILSQEYLDNCESLDGKKIIDLSDQNDILSSARGFYVFVHGKNVILKRFVVSAYKSMDEFLRTFNEKDLLKRIDKYDIQLE